MSLIYISLSTGYMCQRRDLIFFATRRAGTRKEGPKDQKKKKKKSTIWTIGHIQGAQNVELRALSTLHEKDETGSPRGTETRASASNAGFSLSYRRLCLCLYREREGELNFTLWTGAQGQSGLFGRIIAGRHTTPCANIYCCYLPIASFSRHCQKIRIGSTSPSSLDSSS